MRALALLVVTLVGACSPTVVYVYPDAPSEDAGVQALPDAVVLADDATWDASWDEHACLPDRVDGGVSSADCHRFPDRPVCDGLVTNTCVPEATTYCGACETDEQCHRGVDLRADCVFIPYYADRSGINYNDQACLSRCATDSDCDFLPRPTWAGARCMRFSRGSYCIGPHASDPPVGTCSDFMGGRRGSP